MDVLKLPFNEFLGLQLIQQDGREVVCLEAQDHHQNHVGTVHAAASYALAEAASGHALLNSIDLPTKEVQAVVRSVTVKYRRPGSGRLSAIGTISPESAIEFLQKFVERGRAFLTIPVCVSGADGDVLTADFHWFVTRQDKDS